MITLYLFTFSFYTELGKYETVKDCLQSASYIYEDFRYDESIRFSLYCIDEERHPKISEGGIVQSDDFPILQQQP